MKKEFKTDGIRGLAQEDFGPEMFFKIGNFLGQNSGFILVGQDTRETSNLYAQSVINGAISSGCDVFDVGECTTPSLACLTKHYGANYGVMITASHNPYYYNGIKIFNKSGEKINEVLQNKISEVINIEPFVPSYSLSLGKIYDKSSYLIDIYLKEIFEEFDLSSLKEENFLIDASNGGGYLLLPALFHGYGIENFYTIGNKPNGKNINDNVGSLHFANKVSLLNKYKCKFGFALDGDGDRLMGLSSFGVLDGDILSYLIIKYNLKKYSAGAVVTPITNRKIISLLTDLGLKIYQSSVGDQNVYNEMHLRGCKIGFEKSGHILFSNHPCDGIYSMCQFLSTYIKNKEGITNELQNILINPSTMINLKIKNEDACLKKIKSEEFHSKLNKILGNNSYIYIRKSGTENLLRIYLEGESETKIKRSKAFILEEVKAYLCAE